MNSVELANCVKKAASILQAELGSTTGLGLIPGTGWKEGIEAVFKEKKVIPYTGLGVPGSGLEVEGHSKALRIGEIEGQPVFILGRVHANENMSDPDLRQAMMVVIGALKDHLKGVIITNGVGSLHGPVGLDNGGFSSLVRTTFLDLCGWFHRGRRQEAIHVGDIVLVDDIKTALVGSLTPLGAGDFVDYYRDGLHRDGDKYFNLARRVVIEVQGRCPLAQARFIPGPQFEGPADKIEFRAQGDDIIGMSGIQEVLACTRFGVPFVNLALATNGPFEIHSHEVNQDVGKANAEKAASLIKKVAGEWPK